MPAEDPTPEINEIINAYLEDQLPEAAYTWAKEALTTTDNILQTIQEMKALGNYDTSTQLDALEKIYKSAWQWFIDCRI